jgi:hypothetical protein
MLILLLIYKKIEKLIFYMFFNIKDFSPARVKSSRVTEFTRCVRCSVAAKRSVACRRCGVRGLA